MYKRRNSNIVRIVVLVLAVVLCLSLFTGVFSNNKDDDYSKTRMSWTVGGLDEAYKIDKEVESKMVSDRVEIGKGFKIEPDFNKGVSYQVIFYDDLDNWIGVVSDESGAVEFKNICEMTLEEIEAKFEGATYFRVLLTPDDKDGEIGMLEKLKYATHIKVYELDE